MTPTNETPDAITAAVDPQRLGLYLRDNLPQFAGPFRIQRLGEGQSCLTFLVEGDSWRVVLRRPPRGDLPPTAFDVTREYRVMRALAGSGAPVRVPTPLAVCEDKTVIGAPFYLMEEVRGLVVRGELPGALAGLEDRWRMGELLLNTLVSLHQVDYRAVGLEGFGKPEGYLERQLQRMRQLWDRARFRDVPDIEEVGVWLADNLPEEQKPTIVHGDYKLDNVIFAPTSPATLLAIVDWEMSTLGDPLVDLGWMLYFWADPDDAGFEVPLPTVTSMEGFPRRAELLARYAESSGLPCADIPWYVALAGWKIAIIMEGSYRRFLGGIKDHPSFEALGLGVLMLAHRARAATAGSFGL
ncbi:MAG: phosphotransferase family protein [Actinomycetota bacterium]